ncbi:MAG: aminotransferase class III-fold pyridoxal phosphate-dependent enzyme [Bacteroidetes bacterium]|nr:aminotransferase class III-fold pyridoxal phosphate-dependent enzyme [Bacteroidota bacterium]
MKSSLFSTSRINELIHNHYGFKATIKALPGESDLNYYLETENKQKYVLKIAGAGSSFEQLDFQNQMMNHLAKKELPLQLPKPVSNRSGKYITEIQDEEGNLRYMRLLSWVPGRLWAKVNPHTSELLENLGESCGYLCKGLQGFDHRAAHRFYKWNVSKALWTKEFLHMLENVRQEEVSNHFLQLFEKETLPRLKNLRSSVIHMDANDYNVLVDADLMNPKVLGVIDFGDALHTQTVNDLAIACAYAMMHKADPLEAATYIVRGFHKVFPLQEEEVSILFSLITARLLISVVSSAINKRKNPDNEYLLISEKPAWDLLYKLRDTSPSLAHYTFRFACGWEPCPAKGTFEKWVSKNIFFPILGKSLDELKAAPLDLSIGSLELGNASNYETIERFEKTIFRLLDDKQSEIGIGGYGEVRPFYSTDIFTSESNAGPQWRTVHLGTDVWAKANTPIFAPLAGRIHSLKNNKNARDYGPTIILEHAVSDELTFFMLYGHLSSASIDGLKIGQLIQQGQQIGTIGDPPENGNWPPHLHFQIILDMLEMKGDFPGTSFYWNREVWKSICPGPNLLLEFSNASEKEELETSEILHLRQKKLGKSLSVSYKQPLKMVRGYKQYLFDKSGRRYLDTVNNVAHVGHEHPRVVKAAQRQIAVLNTNTRYLHEEIVHFADELSATLPSELCVVHFVNSGSEANELALRMARAYSGQQDMVAIEVGYHGNTGGCIDISSYKFDGKGGKGAPPHTHIVPIPDTFRGLYRRDEVNAGEKYASHVQEAINNVQKQGRNVAGFIAESILSCGGQIVLPEGYLKKAFEYVRAAGGICIADEVQVGFGRVGDTFWGFELQGVVPDIVTMGKPIGNGHPLAAVVTTRKIADAFANGMEYFNTFGGNPVSCAIGREVLKVIKDEGLQQHAKEVGAYLTNGLNELQSHFPIIADVRGPGLFLGFELVKEMDTLKPATQQATYLKNRMQEHSILMSTDGPFENVLKIKPPMCFDKKNADFLIETLGEVLKEDIMKV